MIAGVREGVWAFVGLAVAASAALVVCGAPPHAIPPVVARSPADLAQPPPPPSPGPDDEGTPGAMPSPVVGAARTVAAGPVAGSGARPGPPPPPEVERNATLVVDEEAAARAAARLQVPGLETVEGRVALLPPYPGEDESAYRRRQDELRRRLSADALLEEYLARLDYQSTIYPSDYPLDRVREAARSQVRLLSGQARAELLEEALGGVDGLGATPQFAPSNPSLAASGGSPER